MTSRLTVSAPRWGLYLPTQEFASTFQARELLAAYQRYDKAREALVLRWPLKFGPRRWRKFYHQAANRVLEARNEVLTWGGRP